MNLLVAKTGQGSEGCSSLLLGGDGACGINCSYCGLCRDGVAPIDAGGLAGWLGSGRLNGLEIELITAGYPGCADDLCRLAGDFKSGGAKTVAACFGPGTAREKIDFAALAAAGVDEVSFSLTAASRNLYKMLWPCPDACQDWWDDCWEMAAAAVAAFGAGKVAFNLRLGLGETEQIALTLAQKAHRAGIWSRVSPLAARSVSSGKPVSRGKLLRVLAGLHIIARGLAVVEQMQFGDFGQVIHFGLAPERFLALITGGEAFASAYGYVDCANFGQPPASEPGVDGEGDEVLRQLCAVDWEEAWTTQRKLYQIDELDFDEEEVEAENGSVYAMIAEMGRTGFPK